MWFGCFSYVITVYVLCYALLILLSNEGELCTPAVLMFYTIYNLHSQCRDYGVEDYRLHCVDKSYTDSYTRLGIQIHTHTYKKRVAVDLLLSTTIGVT